MLLVCYLIIRYITLGIYVTILSDSEKSFVRLLLKKSQKVVEKTRKEFNKYLEANYPHNYKEEKNLIIKWHEKIKRNLETKRKRKWIKFKNKSLTTRSNFSKGSDNLATFNTEVEIAPVDIVSNNEY